MLVLVLAMLGLLALVGVTFATYAGTSRMSNRQFMLSLFQPQADELIDFGLAQLITDTNDVRSAIRGHSLARDMFGNDATNNSLLAASPTTGQFTIVSVTQPNPLGNPTGFLLSTNIASNDSNFFGYNFLRWAIQVKYNVAPTAPATGTISQTFEILADSGYLPGSNTAEDVSGQHCAGRPGNGARELDDGAAHAATGALHRGGGHGHQPWARGQHVRAGRPPVARL